LARGGVKILIRKREKSHKPRDSKAARPMGALRSPEMISGGSLTADHTTIFKELEKTGIRWAHTSQREV
jgi:hypothetical protein